MSWIWHPEWTEESTESAGAFVHFRKNISLPVVPESVRIHITADTKYKLYINSKLVSVGPVKGDQHLWFYDELDIQPHLKVGVNTINVRVLRLYHASTHATSFPRLYQPGFLIRDILCDSNVTCNMQTDSTWEAAIDSTTTLPTNNPEDQFLHIYEKVCSDTPRLEWVSAKTLEFSNSHGITAPWKLSPRLIPYPRYEPATFKSIHNLESTLSRADWEEILLSRRHAASRPGISLPAGSRHHLELEVDHHMTALPYFRFEWPSHAGSLLQVTYSECYEDVPEITPWVRRKGDRCDTRKNIIGPKDEYSFGGLAMKELESNLGYHENYADEEVFAPFHFRTFRFLAVDIQVAKSSDLTLNGIDLTKTNYPLQVHADFNVTSPDNLYQDLWTTSIRTLSNCMHDCYEDCPFYEQLQYAMDARSSALFTYSISGDDRLARQAIIQLHNSYLPSVGLTASRAPAHQLQIIPHFSLFWICMISDHFEYFRDASFVRQFMPVCDGVLESFSRRVDLKLGLIRQSDTSQQWDFVDWAEPWKPMGIPPAAERTGFGSYTNMLYAYTLKRISCLLVAIGRPALSVEYQERADEILKSLQTHCFDGTFFTDGLSSGSSHDSDYSQHGQVWAVLCGAATGDLAYDVMKACTTERGEREFTRTSTAMSFYTLRALSMVGRGLYDDHFHKFWAPWRKQLSQNLTTWLEDDVSNRSDCHAWGCSPLYEFMAEVCGLRMVASGEKTMIFQPRVSLFNRLNAKVPFYMNGSLGIAHVHWEREGDIIQVSLSLKIELGEISNIPIRVIFPEGHDEMMSGDKDIHVAMKAIQSPKEI